MGVSVGSWLGSGGETRTLNQRIDGRCSADLAFLSEQALEPAFRVFTTCHYLASVFTETRPGYHDHAEAINGAEPSKPGIAN